MKRPDSGSEGAGLNRFERVWQEWDRARETGKPIPEILAEIPTEKILQLLAGAGSERRYESDVLATEAMNRLSRARRSLDDVADEVGELLENVQAKGESTSREVHATERVVERLQEPASAGGTPAQFAAHSASDQMADLMGRLERVESAKNRLDRARREDAAREERED